jgi:hypothetical protein
MVPSGYWTSSQISSLAKTWNAPHKGTEKKNSENEELHSAKFLPAEYKPVDIIKVVHKQTHLTAGE